VLLDVLGWIGGLLVACGYALVSARRLAADAATFQVLNVVGALLLGVSCAVSGALPSAFLNAVWLVVGLRSLLAWRTRSRGDRSRPPTRADFSTIA
jgi:hypothetical protein